MPVNDLYQTAAPVWTAQEKTISRFLDTLWFSVERLFLDAGRSVIETFTPNLHDDPP